MNEISIIKGKLSMTLILPIEIADCLKLKEEDFLKYEIEDGKLILHKTNGGNIVC